MPGLTTNPNLGIGLGYDGRQDLGYGKNGNSGLGSQWAVTGNAGIYKEKSDYEKELDEDRFDQDKEDDTDVEELEIDVKLKQKSFTSTSKDVSDFGAKYGTDPYSFNGLANTSQYLGASYDRGESVLKEFIREALQEEMLKEITSMSVRVMVKGTVGDTYKKSKANVSNANQMAPGDPSIKQRGYDNNNRKARTPDQWPYSIPDGPTASGTKRMNFLDDNISDEFEWDDDSYTTGKYLYDTTKQDYVDEKNLRNHIKKTKFNLNR